MTSDMIREQQHILACVGTSEEAALIRAKMQTASLLSGTKSAGTDHATMILMVGCRHASLQSSQSRLYIG
jgi:hypothetical protein